MCSVFDPGGERTEVPEVPFGHQNIVDHGSFLQERNN